MLRKSEIQIIVVQYNVTNNCKQIKYPTNIMGKNNKLQKVTQSGHVARTSYHIKNNTLDGLQRK